MQPEALYFTGPGAVELRVEPLQKPVEGQALVETIVTAISPGTEMLAYRGQLPQGLAADETIVSLAGELSYPLKYGYCAVGRVLEVGEDVAPEWIGKNVFSFQPHQSVFVAPFWEMRRLPDDISPDDAVFLPNMETALGLVMDGAPLAGERVAVVGQGIVGLLTTSLLAGFPLDALLTLDRYPARRLASQASGAGESRSPEAIPPAQFGRFDLVYELSGSPEALDTAIALAGVEGRIVVGSWYGSKRAPVNLGDHFHRGRLKLISSQVSRLAPHLSVRWTKDRRLAFAMDLVRKIQPSKFITHRFPLQDAAEAYRLIDREPQNSIQVVFDYV